MKRNGVLFACLLLFLFTINMNAQKSVRLWDGNPPTNSELSGAEKIERNGDWVVNVTTPELYIYLPEKSINTGLAVVICPGGGYGGVAINHEGHDFAKWLNSKGIAGIVLKYRMPNKHKQVPLEDAHQAMRYVREHAKELAINPEKIGVAGFSAGGHLAATVSTHYAASGTSTRPDFSILFYPVITMNAATHGGSMKNLLGDKPSATDVHVFSNEKQVSANTPPTILLLSDDDQAVLPVNSTLYYDALKRNGVPAAMYVFPKGGHGWGMRTSFSYHTQMLTLLEMWLDGLKQTITK